ncbi:MAG: helix-turn-helix transcriptional regulator [Planctomycetota bacterium]|nr:helix-turn-helix transcriptional regulator [Planctomycetota bacterium]
MADVEQKSGLRRSVLSRLENNRTSNPTLLTLQRYAAALGLNLQTTLSSNRA